MTRTPLDLDADQWRRLCMRAFENLPTDTTVTMDDVDAILTWCLPAYLDLTQAPPGPDVPRHYRGTFHRIGCQALHDPNTSNCP